MPIWEVNAHLLEELCGVFIDWEERFYLCVECGEPVYECDWNDHELTQFLCPICELIEEDID